jgi:hypothetical protein
MHQSCTTTSSFIREKGETVVVDMFDIARQECFVKKK